MTVKNAKALPQVWYGLHFLPGVAEYREPDKEPYRIYINESAIRKMNASFAGRPVYVRHVDEVNLENIQEEADGYVVESFFNANDGKTWCKFIVVSDKGHEAIKNGWKLSNAYIPKQMSEGGMWNGVEYQKEITDGEYDHLAIVPNPRYEESIILSPEQFKAYNSEKELELKKLANSKGESSMKFNFFKKSKVDNASDLEGMSVTLPKSGKEVTLETLINEMDKIENMHGYANGDHMVKAGEEELTVNDMIKKYGEMKNKMDEADKAAKEAEANGEGEKEVKNDEKDGDKEEDLEKKKNDKAHYEALKNAAETASAKKEVIVETSDDQVRRGQDRYGSKK